MCIHVRGPETLSQSVSASPLPIMKCPEAFTHFMGRSIDMGGELELKGKEGILVNCTSTGHWKETENQEQLVQDSGCYL